MKIFFYLALTIVTAPSVFSQSVSTGLPFLKIGSDARSIAMGEAFTAVTNDHSSFLYNPAALRRTDRRQMTLSHRSGFADISSDYLGTTLPGDSWSFGIAAFTTSVGGIEVRRQPGDAEGTFDARNAAVSVGAGHSLTDDVSIGLSGKLLYEKIYVDEAGGYSLDGGILYRFSDDLTAGVSVLNLGRMSVLRSAQSVVPTTIRLGGAYHTPFTKELSVLGAIDLVKTLNDESSHLNVGIETAYDSVLMIRAGYQTGYETKSVSGGFGLVYGILRVDYAYVPSSGAFLPNHTVTLNFFL